MAEALTDREYEALMQANRATTEAVASVNTAVANLGQRLGERYLTREEDDRIDERVKQEIYAYIREQDTLVRNEGKEVHESFDTQLKVCFTLIGLLFVAALGEAGWIISSLKLVVEH